MATAEAQEVKDENCSNTTIVVLLCGLPASGKSSFAEFIVANCQESADTSVHHIEYDVVEGSLMLDDENNHDNTPSSYSREIWKTSRTQSLDLLRTHLKTPVQTQQQIIVMDDNFHYRSMRREVYRICQEHVLSDNHSKIYFILLWLDVPKDQCLQRNQQRSRSVPENVIERMSMTLEPPGKETWEQCYLRLDNLPLSLSTTDDYNNGNASLTRVKDFIMHDCRNQCSPVPPPPPPIDLEALEEERRKTRESWLHSWDQQLRSWVGKVASISRQATSKANQARKEILQTLRKEQQKGEEELPSDGQIYGWFLDALATQLTKEQLEQLHTTITEKEVS